MTQTQTDLTISKDVILADHTTIGIGGPAHFFAKVGTLDELQSALTWASRDQQRVLILGGGSNMLVSDEGFQGLVIDLDLLGTSFEQFDGSSVIVEAHAGEDWDSLVQTCVDRSLAGFECLSGIPGSVGATPIQNVGAYGQEVAETIVDLKAWDRAEEKVVTFTNEECGFAYRESRFKSRDRDRFVILSVRYRLKKDAPPTIRYPDLMRHLEEEGITSPTLQDVRRTVLNVRSAKGMVVSKDDPDSRSAGSFFTNPIIPEDQLEEFLLLVKRADVLEEGESVPHYPAGEGLVKLSAAWIIQHAGFHRGHQHGNIGISSKHTLAIVNRGGGTATEVRELVEQIQNRTRRLFRLELVPEPNMIGFDDDSRQSDDSPSPPGRG